MYRGHFLPAMSGMSGMLPVGEFDWNDYTGLVARFPLNSLDALFTDQALTLVADKQQYLEIDQAVTTAYPLTIAGWVKSGTTAAQTAFWLGNKDTADELVSLGFNATGDAILTRQASGGGADVTTGANIDDDAWHFVAVVCTAADDVDLYVDGNAAVNDTTSVAFANFDRMSLGRAGDSTPSGYWEGELDNFMVFDVALSAAQVAWLRDAGAGKSFTDVSTSTDAANPGTVNLQGSWSLDEADDSRVDDSGNSYHMVRHNVPTAANFVQASSQYLTIGTPVAVDYPISMGGWCRTTEGGIHLLCGVGYTGTSLDYQRIQFSAETIFATSRATTSGIASASKVTSVNDGEWHFVVAVFAAANDRRLSVDGSAFSTNVTNRPVDGGAKNYNISRIAGPVNDISGSEFNGDIDDFFFRTSAMTIEEVQWLYNGGKGRTLGEMTNSTHPDKPSLHDHFYTFDGEADGAVATDRVGALNLADQNTVTRITGTVNEYPASAAGKIKEPGQAEDRGTEFRSASSHYAETDTEAIDSTSKTVVAWVKSNDVTEQTAVWIGDKDADDVFTRIGIDSAGKAFLGRNASGGGEDVTVGANVISDGEWHLIMAVLTGIADVDLYVDTAAVVNDTTSVAIAAYDRTSIGRHGGATPATYFNGKIDEAMVFDSALSAANRTTLWAGGAGQLARDNALAPSHAWPLSSLAATGAGEDIGSGSAITLTLTNSPLDTDGIPAGQTLHGAVCLVVDQTSAGNDFLQTTLITRPQIVRMATGNYGLRTDGVDDVMQTAAFAAPETQPNTMFLVAIVRDQTVDQVLVDGIVGTSEHAIQVNATGDLIRVDAGTAVDTTHGVDYGTVHIWTVIFNGDGTNVFMDGGVSSTVAAGAETITGLTLGTLNDGSSDPADADFQYLVLSAGELDNSDLNEIGEYLAEIFGTTWTKIDNSFDEGFSSGFDI